MKLKSPQLIKVQHVFSEAGTLGIIETSKQSPFSFNRFYFFKDVPDDAERGGHAHKRLRQVIFCIRGELTLQVRSAKETFAFHLRSSEDAVVLPPGYWRDLSNFSKDAVVGVLASDIYDEADYIRDWSAYLQWSAEREKGAVPYLDLARYADVMGDEIAGRIRDVLFSGALIGGGELRSFEEAFGRYCKTSSVVGVGNGLQALSLALKALNIGVGQEVILPANSFIATALAVIEAGATPVLVDAEESTGLIDIAAVAAAITPRTAAIIPVHLYGHPCDMDGLKDLIGDRQIWIIEDAAQAHGALYKGRPCGSLGHIAGFSFYPTKNLGAVGDAGCITTNDSALAARVRLLGNYGSAKKYEHLEIGTNSRLDAIQAAALSVKLAYLDEFNARRRAYAEIYLDGLHDVRGLALPKVHDWATPVWHVFPIRVPAARRVAFIEHMTLNKIGTNIHYPTPIHLQPCCAYLGLGEGSFPVSERLSQELVSLPLDPTHTPAEIRRVVEVVCGFFVDTSAEWTASLREVV